MVGEGEARSDPALDLEVFVTGGLGDNSYLLASGDEAVVVDPQRDAWRFLEVAMTRGWSVRAVLETHVHNDYASGAHEIRAATGADLVVPAAGRYTFDHRPAEDGFDLALGDLAIVARATPGHTPEHISWEVRGPDAAPRAVFTGGSLLVGSAGRSDLLGTDVAEGLARDQFRSIQRLAALPDDVRVLPTHGAGSFCVAAASAGEARTSTIGAERFANPAVWGSDEDEFVRGHLSGLPAYPAYYRHMAPLNRVGAPVLGGLPTLAALSADEVAAAVANGAWVIDTRGRHEFAAAHIPGSLNVELADSFAAYVGWVVPFGEPLVLVLREPWERAGAAAVTQLLRIGWDRLLGALAGGVAAWTAAGHATREYGTASMRDLHRIRVGEGTSVPVLDVRQAVEWRREPGVPDCARAFVGDLPAQVGALAESAGGEETWVYCATGYRAAIAASLLDRAGVPVRLVATGGGSDWPRL